MRARRREREEGHNLFLAYPHTRGGAEVATEGSATEQPAWLEEEDNRRNFQTGPLENYKQVPRIYKQKLLVIFSGTWSSPNSVKIHGGFYSYKDAPHIFILKFGGI